MILLTACFTPRRPGNPEPRACLRLPARLLHGSEDILTDPAIGFLFFGLALACAVVSAKWAMDLGYGQSTQALYGVAGAVFGPLILLLLYVRLLRSQQARHLPGGRVI